MTPFSTLNIKNKIIVGFIPLLMIMMIIAGFSFLSLKEADQINRTLIDRDLILLETADKLLDELLAQELYGRRYTILKSPEMLTLFQDQSRAFQKLVAGMKKVPGKHDIAARRLAVLHEEFNLYYHEWFKKIKSASPVSTDENDTIVKKKLDQLIAYIQVIVKDTKADQKRSVARTGEMALGAIQTIIILSGIGIIVGIAIVSLITRSISRSITQLKIATKRISEGEFDHVLKVNTGDELGELAVEFKKMADRLAQLEEMYLDASPLTRLPGGEAIENVLNKHLKTNRPIAFVLLDLDNFKSYNDKYGYARGNDMITSTAEIIKCAVSDHGGEDDFIGHIGGDDFSVITTPEKYAEICQNVIDNFDKNIENFYDSEDRKNGCITSKNRQGEKMKFPLMTISIAVVITNETEQMNRIEIGEIAAELKKYAKSLPGSVFVVNRREIS